MFGKVKATQKQGTASQGDLIQGRRVSGLTLKKSPTGQTYSINQPVVKKPMAKNRLHESHLNVISSQNTSYLNSIRNKSVQSSSPDHNNSIQNIVAEKDKNLKKHEKPLQRKEVRKDRINSSPSKILQNIRNKNKHHEVHPVHSVVNDKYDYTEEQKEQQDLKRSMMMIKQKLLQNQSVVTGEQTNRESESVDQFERESVLKVPERESILRNSLQREDRSSLQRPKLAKQTSFSASTDKLSSSIKIMAEVRPSERRNQDSSPSTRYKDTPLFKRSDSNHSEENFVRFSSKKLIREREDSDNKNDEDEIVEQKNSENAVKQQSPKNKQSVIQNRIFEIDSILSQIQQGNETKEVKKVERVNSNANGKEASLGVKKEPKKQVKQVVQQQKLKPQSENLLKSKQAPVTRVKTTGLIAPSIATKMNNFLNDKSFSRQSSPDQSLRKKSSPKRQVKKSNDPPKSFQQKNENILKKSMKLTPTTKKKDQKEQIKTTDEDEQISQREYTLAERKIILNREDLNAKTQNIPQKFRQSAKQLSGQLTSTFKKELDRVGVIFLWIAKNIAYDVEGSTQPDLKIILSTNKTVSSGYAALFSELAQAAGIEAVTINGYGSGSTARTEMKPDCYWNAVKINNCYYLVDCAMAAGTVKDGHFKKELEQFWFLTPPSEFICSHFPLESQWQLLVDRTISLKDWQNQLEFRPKFFEFGLRLPKTLPNYLVVLNQVYEFEVEAPGDVNFQPTLISIAKGRRQIENACFCQYISEGVSKILVTFDQPGKFLFQLFAKKGKYASQFCECFEFLIEFQGVIQGKFKGFPSQFSKLQVVEPLAYYLPRRKVIPIKIYFPSSEQVCVVHRDKWINMVRNDDDGAFEAEIITSNYDQKNDKIEVIARDSKFVLLEFAIYDDPLQQLSEQLQRRVEFQQRIQLFQDFEEYIDGIDMNQIQNPILREKRSYLLILKAKFPVDFLVKLQQKDQDKQAAVDFQSEEIKPEIYKLEMQIKQPGENLIQVYAKRKTSQFNYDGLFQLKLQK